MSELSLVVGIASVCFLLLYFAFQVEHKHYLLRLILVFASVFLLLLIPKVGLDYQDNCDYVVANETITGNTTAYVYDYFCSESTQTTPRTFYTSLLWVIRIFIFYVAVYFMYEVLQYLRKSSKS